MNRFIRDWFTFSRKERNGIIILLIIIALLILVRFSGFLNRPVPPVEQEDEFTEKWEELQQKITKANKKQANRTDKPELLPPETISPEYFLFDPNQVDYDKLQKLGFNTFQAQNLLKYRKKGGKFEEKEDILRIYGITKEDFNRLAPYIDLPKKKQSYTEPKDSSSELERMPVYLELNTVNADGLQKISGIGTAFSNRIIKYRNLLGGYYKKSQLLEVYGLDTLLYQKIIDHLYVDTSNIRRIALNSQSIDSLFFHPYLTDYQVKAIIRFMQFNDYRIGHLSEIREKDVIPVAVYRKIKPYIAMP